VCGGVEEPSCQLTHPRGWDQTGTKTGRPATVRRCSVQRVLAAECCICVDAAAGCDKSLLETSNCLTLLLPVSYPAACMRVQVDAAAGRDRSLFEAKADRPSCLVPDLLDQAVKCLHTIKHCMFACLRVQVDAAAGRDRSLLEASNCPTSSF
jgi:hypothetical protein